LSAPGQCGRENDRPERHGPSDGYATGAVSTHFYGFSPSIRGRAGDVSPVRGELIRAAGARDKRFRIVDGGVPPGENRQRRPCRPGRRARAASLRARARQPVGRVAY
jgi:hypothetical protein